MAPVSFKVGGAGLKCTLVHLCFTFRPKFGKKQISQNSLYTEESESVPDWVLKGHYFIILLETLRVGQCLCSRSEWA